MTTTRGTLLSVGATGSIGPLVVEQARANGWNVRVLVRDADTADFPSDVEIAVGELTDASTLEAAVDGIDAVVFTHGSYESGVAGSGVREVDYGGVFNVLTALGGHRVRIALMTHLGVTNTDSPRNEITGSADWKRRAERLVRASGNPFTIVRPGWFDYQELGCERIALLQGDTHWTGTPADGTIARGQVARVVVEALGDDAAVGTTFEVQAERGPNPESLTPLFVKLERDNGLDGVHDADTLPIDEEPADINADLSAVRGLAAAR